MAVQWHQTQHPGIRYRLHPTRKHGIGPDKYYVIRHRHEGRRVEEALGWASEGWTLQRAAQTLADLQRAKATAEGAATLRDKREARAEARKKQAEEEATQKARGSVRELLEAYVENLKQDGKRSWPVVQRALVTGKYSALVLLGAERKAQEVSPRDIQQALKETHRRGKSAAAHLRAYLHGAFAFGIGREFDYTRPKQEVSFSLASNPVAAVPRDASAFKAGARALDPEEIGQVWRKLPYSGVEEATWQAIRLIFAVGGQRVLEVLHAEKREFDLEKALWTLPPERTKNGREHVVPLTPRAIGIISECLDVAGPGPFLFPLRGQPDEPMPATSLNRATSRFCARADMKPWSPRDIRRTVRTRLADKGIPGHQLNWHFNHGFQGVGEKHYDRSHHLDDKLEVMRAWDKLLGRIIGEDDGGKVLALPRRKAGSE